MKVSAEMRLYLEGERFSNGQVFRLAEAGWQRVKDRISVLEDYARGKDIVHVGCADHLALISEKRARNVWLHERLNRVATRALGVDIDERAIDHLHRDLGYDDVICADIAGSTVSAIGKCNWDLMVLGELVEHLDNQVEFLSQLRLRYANCCRTLVVTTPNALRWDNLRFALRHSELNNSDHKCYHSPYTLAHTLTRAGFHVDDFELVSGYPIRLRGPRSACRLLFRSLFAVVNDTIVMRASFNRP